MRRFFDPNAETMSVDSLRNHQNRLLAETVRRCAGNNYWADKFATAGLKNVADFRGLDDLRLLPTMSKEDFRQTYPLGMCTVDKTEIREMHMSSGSTGTPIVMPYTQSDLDQWSQCMARCYVMAGAQVGDVVQVTPSFGLFNGGFGMYHGARAADLFAIPTGSGNTERQVTLARDFKTKILGGVVSYALRILEVMREKKIDLPDLKIGVFGAETFSTEMRTRIEKELGITVFDIYGMTETGGVGTLGMDCSAHDGLHVWEDHYVLEILEPGTNNPCSDGELGELTVTSLTRRAIPVIRFRTGDLTKIISRKTCSCGRTHLRISPILGRTDDMLIVKGVNFFPKQIEHALLEIPGVLPHYQIIIEEIDGVRDVRINVEAEEGVTGYTIEKHLKERLGFSPKGDVFKPGELPRQEGKAKRVFYS